MIKTIILTMILFTSTICFAGGDISSTSYSPAINTNIELLRPTVPKEATFDDVNIIKSTIPVDVILNDDKDIRYIIAKSIKYPDFGYKKDINDVVYVIFTISTEGKIKIFKISSDNVELKNYVNEQISNIIIKNVKNSLDYKYSIKLEFLSS